MVRPALGRLLRGQLPDALVDGRVGLAAPRRGMIYERGCVEWRRRVAASLEQGAGGEHPAEDGR